MPGIEPRDWAPMGGCAACGEAAPIGMNGWPVLLIMGWLERPLLPPMGLGAEGDAVPMSSPMRSFSGGGAAAGDVALGGSAGPSNPARRSISFACVAAAAGAGVGAAFGEGAEASAMSGLCVEGRRSELARCCGTGAAC